MYIREVYVSMEWPAYLLGQPLGNRLATTCLQGGKTALVSRRLVHC